MQNPQLSIIIPVFNSGETAVKLVKKILQDKFQNFEILIIDDGSTDDSLKFLRGLKSKKVHLLAQKHSGPSTARNLGLKNAKGNYISFIDSDDDISPRFLTKLTDEMKSNDLVVCQIKKDKTSKKPKPVKMIKTPLEKYILKDLLTSALFYSSVNKIYRADFIKKHHLKFDESLNFAEDTKFVLDYIQKTSPKISIVNEPLYIYKTHSDSTVNISNKSWQKWQKSYEYLKKWDKNQHKILLRLIKLRWRVSWLRRRGK